MKNFIELISRLNLTFVSHASSIEDTKVTITNSTTTGTSGLLSVLIFMLIFIAISGALVFLFIVLRKTSKEQAQANKSISVLDKIPLDHNSSLFIVEIQDKIHILGKTDSNISNISEITDEQKISILKLDCLNKQDITFQNVLGEQLNIMNNSIHKKNNPIRTKAFKIQK